MENCTCPNEEQGNCSIDHANAELVSLSKGFDVFLLSLNLFLSITASVGNALILIALSKVSCLHPPTKLLFRCLAVTDLGVGVVVQPVTSIAYLGRKVVTPKIDWDVVMSIGTVTLASSYVFCGVSLIASTAISVDRLLALLLGLRYRHVVTLRRVRAFMMFFLLVTVLVGLVHYFAGKIIPFILAYITAVFSVVTSIFCHSRIFLRLRQHRAQVQSHALRGEEQKPLNIAQYKKTVCTIAWVQFGLVFCYGPLILAGGVNDVILTLMFLNSSINPILYCWKIREIRQSVKNIVARCCCLSG